MDNIPTHTINFSDKISCFELSSYEFTKNLICVALSDKIILGLLQFPEDSALECLEWKELKEIHSASRVESLAIAPNSTLVSVPKSVIFCTAGSDYNIRIYATDLENANTVEVLSGHKSYINSVAWDYSNEFLASGSDDHTLMIWNIQDNCKCAATFYFQSSVVTCKWHPDESEKLMVAEKNGTIHLYNITAGEVLLSVETILNPLMCADWSLSNSAFICAIAAGETFIWDLKTPSRPVDTKHIHEDVGLAIKFSPHNELLTASIGRPMTTLKVMNCKSQIPQVEAPLILYGGLCWHYKHAYVGAAQDRKLCFWKVISK
uniref:CSON003920 protein n=1 Tax=Culicoides sonorensis TaxID=179676 RepID=A0A336LSZ6_CULSO